MDRSHLIACMDRTFSDYILWWMPGGNGYTHDIDRAGRYTREEYERVVSQDARTKHVLVPLDIAERKTERVVAYWALRSESQ